MTMTETPSTEVESVEGSEGAPPEGGQAPSEAPLLDLDQYGDHLVTVTVNGEDQQIPLRDARNGFMQHGDYTRKTQELAAEREALAEARQIAEALELNPQETLRVLGEYYGAIDDEQEVEETDPLKREVGELREFVEAQKQEAAERELWGQLDTYNERYGVDQEELLRFAVDNQIPNLDWAFAMMSQAKTEAQAQADEQRRAAEEARNEGKRQAGLMEGGADRASGASGPHTGSSKTVRSVADAFELAKAQLQS